MKVQKFFICAFIAFLLGLLCVVPEEAMADPVGTVITYYGVTPPDGYLACDGSQFDAAVYPQLAAVLGGNVTPDLRGYFVRGYDTRNTVDTNGAGRALGSAQGDAIRNIKGDAGWGINRLFTVANGVFRGVASTSNHQAMMEKGTTYAWKYVTFDASTVVPVANENRPKNKTLLYCIKHDEADTPAPGGDGFIPNLQIGVEVKWPVLREGKQVYAKLIDFRGFPPYPSRQRSTSHGIQNIEWVQISWDHSIIRSSTDAMNRRMGLVSSDTALGTTGSPWRFLVDNTGVQLNIYTNNDFSALDQVILCILYTKTTDEPVQP